MHGLRGAALTSLADMKVVQRRLFQVSASMWCLHELLTQTRFALPDSHIVTSLEDAAKIAGHELKGCADFLFVSVRALLTLLAICSCGCYYNAAIPGLAVPLMCLVDYKGFRLIAITLLPIDRTTLVGGTADAGRCALLAALHADIA